MTAAASSPLERALRLALVLVLAGALGPILMVLLDLGRTDRLDGDALYLLTATQEPIHLLGLALVLLGMLAFVGRAGGQPAEAPAHPWRLAAGLAVAAALVARIGTDAVFSGHLLSGDEQATDWLARLLITGRVEAAVPEHLLGVGAALESAYTRFHPGPGTLRSAYLPVYAAIRGLFISLGLVEWTNPALVLVSVLAVAATLRQLVPERPELAVLGAALCACSIQVLVVGMTGYAMAGHLALNSVWLALWARGGRAAWIAPLIGVLALGLHNPVMHPLFVAPFLLRPVRERRWALVAWCTLVYGVACLVWLRWFHWTFPVGASPAPGAEAAVSLPFSMPDSLRLVIHSCYVTLLSTWHAAPTLGLVALALSRWRNLPPLARDCALSFGLTWAFFLFFTPPQGNGWGFRYSHGLLANLFVLAALGAGQIGLWTRRTALVLAAGLAASALIFLPLRATQVRAYVQPFVQAEAWLAEQPDELLLIDPLGVWYGVDLARNSPDLDAPIRLNARKTGPGPVGALVEAGHAVRPITAQELVDQGMSPLLRPR